MKYKDYLKSEHWKQVRKWCLEKCGYKCGFCKKEFHPSNLQVHHWTYENLGKELERDLIVLCNRCHEKVHGIAKELRISKIRKHKKKREAKKRNKGGKWKKQLATGQIKKTWNQKKKIVIFKD